jgi:hypothetical protein
MLRSRTWLAAAVMLKLAAPTLLWSETSPTVLPGDAVRVRAPARIVIPGVITLEGGYVSTRFPWEEKEGLVVLRDGDRTLYLPRPGRRLAGRLVNVTDEFVTLEGVADRIVTVPRQAVGRMEVRRGGSHRRTGALLGAVTAFVMGYKLGYRAEKDCGGWCFPGPAGVGAGLLLAIPGAAAGASLGGATERWEPVSTETLRVGIALRQGGGTVGVSVRF